MRTTINSQYGQQIQEATQAQFDKYECEEGALVKVNGIIYVGINSNWVQLYPATAEGLSLGWQRVDDTEYTLANPFNFSANTEYTMPNDAGNDEQQNLNVYKGGTQKFQLEAKNNVYILTIAFKAHLNTNNGHMELYLTTGGLTPYERNADIIIFPKGNGVEHVFSRTFQFYADNDSITTGLQVKFEASHAGSIYEVIYFIQKVQNYG
jgi:hypothetical protein